jgi:DNA polymerase-1
MRELSEALADAKLIVLDVETLKVDTFTGKDLLGVAIGVPRGIDVDGYYVLPADLHKYKTRLSELDIVAHNILFDAEIMEQNGVPLNGGWYDTLTMAHLNNENEFNFGLDSLARKYCGVGKLPMKEVEKAFGHWNNIPVELMEPYAKNDVAITWKLFMYLTAKLAEQGLTKLYENYKEYLKALQYIQAQGIVVDWDMVERRRVEAEQQLKRLQYVELGYDPSKSSVLDYRLYEVAGLPVIQRTEVTHKPKTDVAVLQALRESYPEHRLELDRILRYRNLQKANGNWYAGYLKYKDETGLIHPNFKVHGTQTGRLSCEAPNLQQIPRDYSRVKCFFRDNPARSEVLVELDFSQIELRVAAYYAMKAKDPTMYNIYKEGGDVHSRSAELVGAYDQIANRSEARQVGKTGNFLWIYGGGPKTMSAQLYRQFGFSSSREQCKDWGNRFHASYPGFQRCIDKSSRKHQRDGYITFFNGRRRRIRERDAFGATAHRKAFNAIVQGGCSQLLMYSIIKIHRAIEAGEVRARVCNTVHDSLWVYVPAEGIDEETEKLSALMRSMPERVFQLPFDIDAKVMVQ